MSRVSYLSTTNPKIAVGCDRILITSRCFTRVRHVWCNEKQNNLVFLSRIGLFVYTFHVNVHIQTTVFIYLILRDTASSTYTYKYNSSVWVLLLRQEAVDVIELLKEKRVWTVLSIFGGVVKFWNSRVSQTFNATEHCDKLDSLLIIYQISIW